MSVANRNFLRVTRKEAAATPFLENCDICFGTGEDDAGFELKDVYIGGCGHKACLSCVQTHVDAAIKNDQAQVTCFAPDCGAAIGGGDVHAILRGVTGGEEALASYERILTEAAMGKMGKLVYCPDTKCGAPIVAEAAEPKISCPYCKESFCLECKVPWHEGSTCEKYQEWKRENGEGDVAFERWQAENHTKPCPTCAAVVLRSEGCNCMTCKSPQCAGGT